MPDDRARLIDQEPIQSSIRAIRARLYAGSDHAFRTTIFARLKGRFLVSRSSRLGLLIPLDAGFNRPGPGTGT